MSFKIHFQAVLWSWENWKLMQMKSAEIPLQSQGSRSWVFRNPSRHCTSCSEAVTMTWTVMQTWHQVLRVNIGNTCLGQWSIELYVHHVVEAHFLLGNKFRTV